jgi:hypothetical protein
MFICNTSKFKCHRKFCLGEARVELFSGKNYAEVVILCKGSFSSEFVMNTGLEALVNIL